MSRQKYPPQTTNSQRSSNRLDGVGRQLVYQTRLSVQLVSRECFSTVPSSRTFAILHETLSRRENASSSPFCKSSNLISRSRVITYESRVSQRLGASND